MRGASPNGSSFNRTVDLMSIPGRKTSILLAVAMMAGLTVTAAGQESSGGIFSIGQVSVHSGGGMSQGGPFSVRGTIGQATAGETPATGGVFSLRGGFWSSNAVTPSGEQVFSDSFESP